MVTFILLRNSVFPLLINLGVYSVFMILVEVFMIMEVYLPTLSF